VVVPVPEGRLDAVAETAQHSARLLRLGRSDNPVAREFYTFDRQCRSIQDLVDALGLSALTVVVHRWGGPIGFQLAVERPDLVTGLVVLHTGIFSGRAPSYPWLQFRDLMRREFACTVWTPGGSRLACVGSSDIDPSRDGIYTVRSSDGGDLRLIAPLPNDNWPGDFSPMAQAWFSPIMIRRPTRRPLGCQPHRRWTPPDHAVGHWS
jgi:pimeloyl-ACP methyl ester carboxylesterase